MHLLEERPKVMCTSVVCSLLHPALASPSPSPFPGAGQPTLRQLRELYRLQAQGPATKVFGIVGNPVSHRWAALHGCWFVWCRGGAGGVCGVRVVLVVCGCVYVWVGGVGV